MRRGEKQRLSNASGIGDGGDPCSTESGISRHLTAVGLPLRCREFPDQAMPISCQEMSISCLKGSFDSGRFTVANVAARLTGGRRYHPGRSNHRLCPTRRRPSYFECTFVFDGTNMPFPPEYLVVASGTGPPGVGCCAGDCTSKTASNIEPWRMTFFPWILSFPVS